jgi:outer membrane protein OmpA-like peptidoglycan-associated protein
MKKLIWTPRLILLLTLWCFPVLAEDVDSFEATRLRPVADHSPYLHLYQSHLRPQGGFSFGLFMNYAEGPLKADNFPVATPEDPIKRHVLGHFLGSYSFFDFMNVNLDFPVAFLNSYNGLPDDGTDFSLGDLLLNMKFKVLDGRSSPVGLAFLPFITFPTGNGLRFTGMNDFSGGITMISDRDFGKWFFASNMGWHVRDKAVRGGLSVNDLYTFGLGFGGRLGWGLTPRIEVVGATEFAAFFAKETTPLEALISTEKVFEKGIELDLGVGIGIVRAFSSPAFRVIFGISCTEVCFGQSSEDGDERYRPPSRDGGGSSTHHPSPRGGGSMASPYKPAPRVDTDGDGLDDLEDRCPMMAGTYSNQGCPAVQAPAPQSSAPPPAGASKYGQPGQQPRVFFSASRIETPPLNFEPGKTAITAEISPTLDEVVAGLRARPFIKVIRVEGHTDSSGEATANIKLSKARALAIAQYLDERVKNIVIEYVGWGPQRPIYSNETRAGRDNNRRVEILIIKAEQAPAPPPRQ